MYEHYDQSSSCTEIDIEIVSAKTFELCLPIYHIKQAYDWGDSWNLLALYELSNNHMLFDTKMTELSW